MDKDEMWAKLTDGTWWIRQLLKTGLSIIAWFILLLIATKFGVVAAIGWAFPVLIGTEGLIAWLGLK